MLASLKDPGNGQVSESDKDYCFLPAAVGRLNSGNVIPSSLIIDQYKHLLEAL